MKTKYKILICGLLLATALLGFFIYHSSDILRFTGFAVDTINPDGSVTTHGKGGDITRYPDQQTTKITQTPEQEQKWKERLK